VSDCTYTCTRCFGSFCKDETAYLIGATECLCEGCLGADKEEHDSEHANGLLSFVDEDCVEFRRMYEHVL